MTSMRKPISIAAALFALGALAMCLVARASEEPKWEPISDGVIAKLTEDGKKIGWPGLTGGIAVDRTNGDVFMVVCDNGMWKSSDQGKTFERVDNKTIGGRTETGFALDIDPNGKRMMCFMIYGGSAITLDSGKTWQSSKQSHLDFGQVEWSEPAAQKMISLKHESGGELVITNDGAKTWTALGKGYKYVGIFEGGVLVATKPEGILRSTDEGKTWNKVSDLKPTGGAMRSFKGVGYWLSDAGVLTSKDKGETWAVLGSAIKASWGPYFGKDESNLIVASKDGVFETTDAGKTWAKIAPFPPGFPPGPVGPNFGYDPEHRILYASAMGKQAYKLVR